LFVKFACKVIKQDESYLKGIENEQRAIINICTSGNKNIVQVFQCWEEVVDLKRKCFIVMELCDCDLARAMDLAKRDCDFWTYWFQPDPVHQYYMNQFIAILDGLVFMHSRNEIHRDLKPANSMSPWTVFAYQ